MTYFAPRAEEEYMGEKTVGIYVYQGFKEKGNSKWKIMREDTNDPGAWQYAYGTSGWTAAWANPELQTYGDP